MEASDIGFLVIRASGFCMVCASGFFLICVLESVGIRASECFVGLSVREAALFGSRRAGLWPVASQL
jgi:hypothetical protein